MRRDYRKVLYLDSDIWIAGRSIGDLFNLDLRNYAVAAVRDSGEIVRGGSPEWLTYKSKLGLAAAAPYFNAGILLIDLERFHQRGIGEDAIRYVAGGKYLGGLDDQSALNAVLRGDWLELSPRWNWTFASRDALTRELAPEIVHFVGGSKPWNDGKGRYHARYRLAMQEYLGAVGLGGFVKSPAIWPLLQRRIANFLRGLGAGVMEDSRTLAIRRFAQSTGFAKVEAAGSGLPERAAAAQTRVRAG